jgi:hypothetical protein
MRNGGRPIIRTYYQLTTDEVEAFEARLRQQTYQEVREMEQTYYSRLAREMAREVAQEVVQEVAREAAQQAAREAAQEGMRYGIRHILLQQLTTKFGELTPDTINRVQAIQSQDELTLLATKVLTANSLTELGLNGAD